MLVTYNVVLSCQPHKLCFIYCLKQLLELLVHLVIIVEFIFGQFCLNLGGDYGRHYINCLYSLVVLFGLSQKDSFVSFGELQLGILSQIILQKYGLNILVSLIVILFLEIRYKKSDLGNIIHDFGSFFVALGRNR